MKKYYWPMAVALDCNNVPVQLFTNESCDLTKCRDVFKNWQDNYNYTLLVTWIDVIDSDDGTKTLINHRCHVNAIGQVKKL